MNRIILKARQGKARQLVSDTVFFACFHNQILKKPDLAMVS